VAFAKTVVLGFRDLSENDGPGAVRGFAAEEEPRPSGKSTVTGQPNRGGSTRMVQKPRWLSIATAGIVAMMVFVACTPAAAPTTRPATPGTTGAAATGTPAAPATGTPAAPRTPGDTPGTQPTGTAPASVEPSASAPAATPYPDPETTPSALTADLTEYPNYGEVDCENGTFNGLPYTGRLKSMTAPDPQTVVFEFCEPNVAFLSQIGFASLAIDDGQYLIDNMPTAITGEGEPLPEGSLLVAPNGTGPYQLDEWDRGNRMTFTAFEDYWGDAPLTPNLELRWSDQAAARYQELNAGTVDGIDNPDAADLPAIEGNADLAFIERTAINTLYFGMINTFEPWDDVNVRKAVAMGIDRQRILDTFFPPGSQVASHFTPCEVPHGCAGTDFNTTYPFDAPAAAQMLRDAGIQEGYPIKLQYRAAVRPYIPDPPTIAQEVASQLETNLGFDVTIEEQESGTFLDNQQAGTLDGLYLLGWIADYPDASNFLDFHFGPGTGVKFGDPIPELVDVIRQAGETADEDERDELYGQANDLIAEHVPMVPVIHSGSGTAFKADVTGTYASPLTNELFAEMQAADRDLLSFMQNAEPLSLWCGDETDGETFRACLQMKEALYGYRGGTIESTPVLATECLPNEELTVWTCTLRDGVTFHNGETFDASDVIVSFAAQWDALSPQHVGRTASFEYWPALIGGGYLNPPGPCGLPNTAPCPAT
jgi:ABC-type transport system substrate-binding protein